MATVELSAGELQAIIDGLLFRIGGLSDLADPSHVKEGRISADDAAGWGEEAKFSRELADRLMELRDQADRPREANLCALLKFSADWLDHLAEGARLTEDERLSTVNAHLSKTMLLLNWEISSPGHSMDNRSDHPTRKPVRGNVNVHVHIEAVSNSPNERVYIRKAASNSINEPMRLRARGKTAFSH